MEYLPTGMNDFVVMYLGSPVPIYIMVAIAAYFLGCFNGAVIVSKYILRNDIRNHGSGNAGLTNFHRVFGGGLTFVVILCDVLKAVLAVLIGSGLFGLCLENAVLGKYWAGLFCLLGHMFPCMFGFKGGKGILSGGTIAIMIDWRVALVVWGGFLVLAALTRWVSLGSCYFENETGKYLFIDTAGMRKKSKVDDRIEKFSVLRATMAIERADVCLILIDANEGVTEQDTKVAGLAHEAGKASILVVNKWDAIEKDDKTMDRMREDIRRDLSYMTYAPIVFISAMTGQRVPRLFELINYVNDQAAMRITTGMLNSVLADATARVQPPSDKGRRLKIFYMTQVGIKPPHFVCFCNDAQLFHFSYQRYIENQIRNTFGLEGTPVRLTIRQKGDKEG